MRMPLPISQRETTMYGGRLSWAFQGGSINALRALEVTLVVIGALSEHYRTIGHYRSDLDRFR